MKAFALPETAKVKQEQRTAAASPSAPVTLRHRCGVARCSDRGGGSALQRCRARGPSVAAFMRVTWGLSIAALQLTTTAQNRRARWKPSLGIASRVSELVIRLKAGPQGGRAAVCGKVGCCHQLEMSSRLYRLLLALRQLLAALPLTCATTRTRTSTPLTAGARLALLVNARCRCSSCLLGQWRRWEPKLFCHGCITGVLFFHNLLVLCVRRKSLHGVRSPFKDLHTDDQKPAKAGCSAVTAAEQSTLLLEISIEVWLCVAN